MNKAIFLVLVSLMLPIPSVAYATEPLESSECQNLSQKVASYIVAQNHCEKDGDCTQWVCPFGWINYIHKDSVDEVNKKIKILVQKTCNIYRGDCSANAGAICKENKCVANTYNKNTYK